MKLAKLFVAENEVCAGYETFATGDVDFEALIARVVITLYETKTRFDKEMKGLL